MARIALVRRKGKTSEERANNRLAHLQLLSVDLWIVGEIGERSCANGGTTLVITHWQTPRWVGQLFSKKVNALMSCAQVRQYKREVRLMYRSNCSKKPKASLLHFSSSNVTPVT